MTLLDAARQALEALEWIARVNAMDYEYQAKAQTAIPTLRQAIDQAQQCVMENAQGDLERISLVQTGVGIGKPEQEPVAWITAGQHTAPLRTHWEGCEAVHPECKAEQQEEGTVMAEYKFQPYAAYKKDGEMKIGGVPEPEQEPVAWLYTLEYGSSIANRTVSLKQLRYPFGVCGADYLRVNDDGMSYVRETPLYHAQKEQA